ncbi:MAG: hypothetical protein K2I67_00530 [Malacoplasma sp.]|nr:hypothetical protein [Malacoplasma sp.]
MPISRPRRNGQGCPGLIYRIDFREPSEIFEHGFRPWGNNRNFFQHILGYSLGDEIPEEQRTRNNIRFRFTRL